MPRVLNGKGLRRKRVNDRKEIKGELNRQNQNYIEHLTYHGSPRAAVLAEDEGGTY